MRHLFLIIAILFLFCACKPDPTYNPFDDVFDINVNKLVEDKCDTISAGCCYFNLSKRFDQYSMYYQTYCEDPDIVVAKGLEIYLDTVQIHYDMDKEFEYVNTLNYVWEVPIDTNKIDIILNSFMLFRKGRKFGENFFENFLLFEDTVGTKFAFNSSVIYENKGTEIVRTFEIFLGRPRIDED